MLWNTCKELAKAKDNTGKRNKIKDWKTKEILHIKEWTQKDH